MKFRAKKIAPLAMSVVLAFGVAACENTTEGIQEDTQDAEQELEEGAEDAEQELEEGADEMEEEMDEEATDE